MATTSSSRMAERTKICVNGDAVPVILPQNTPSGSRARSSFLVKPSAGVSSSATPVRCLEAPLSGCWTGTIFRLAIAGKNGSGAIRTSVLERFEQRAPASVMARVALEHALPSDWINAVFEEHRQRQYSRELLFSTVIELVTLVSLGLRPSLHAAARTLERLPVSIGALYDKVNRTEPGVLRALVRGSAERLGPVTAGWDGGASLPGWQLRVLDGNHLPASEKRLAPLRGHRGAALPGHTLVVYDPDCGLVTDILPCEDAHQSERAAVADLLDSARPGQLWIADRQFCTRTVLLGWQAAQAGFLVREHGRHPQLAAEGPWRACGRTDTGAVREQRIELAGASGPWRRIELALDTPTEAGGGRDPAVEQPARAGRGATDRSVVPPEVV